jgi:periplasmic divalent cation tolerance protein
MYVAIYTTFSKLQDAKNIGRILVQKKLVACVNIVSNVFSIYNWKGKIEEETEVVLWCKTRGKLVESIKELIHEIHPYELPAFVVYPIKSGSEAYLKWIEEETRSSDIN